MRRARGPGWGLTLAAVVVAVLFFGPLGYVVWRNLTTGADLWAELREGQAFASLGRTVILATTVSAGAAVVGTGAGVVDDPDRRARAPAVADAGAAAAGVPLLRRRARPSSTRSREGGLVEEWFGVSQLVELRGWFGAWLVLVLFT